MASRTTFAKQERDRAKKARAALKRAARRRGIRRRLTTCGPHGRGRGRRVAGGTTPAREGTPRRLRRAHQPRRLRAQAGLMARITVWPHTSELLSDSPRVARRSNARNVPILVGLDDRRQRPRLISAVEHLDCGQSWSQCSPLAARTNLSRNRPGSSWAVTSHRRSSTCSPAGGRCLVRLSSTLVDLAVAASSTSTQIDGRLLVRPRKAAQDLTVYERQVLDLVQRQASSGVVPSARDRRYRRRAKSFTSR